MRNTTRFMTSWMTVATAVSLLGCQPAAGIDIEVVDDATVRWEGRAWRAIDEEGVFVADTEGWPADVPMPEPNRTIGETIERRGANVPVRCRLVDYVDCTRSDTHDFKDDGESRVLHLPSGRFRVTGAPSGFELKWFVYYIRTADRAGRPHLLVYELSNDRERYTTVTLTTPSDERWSPPFTGQESVEVNAMKISQEPLWYEPDVGLAVYTGRDLPVDNRSFLSHFVFYPKTARVKLTVSSSGWDRPPVEESGGAVSRIWVFEMLDDPAERRPEIEPPADGPERRFGLYTTHPWYFLAHYGVPPHTEEQRRQSLEKLCDLLAFNGMNMLQYNAINGSDRAGRAWYPGAAEYEQLGANLLAELPPVAAGRGIDLVPVVTSITAPSGSEGDRPNQYGFSKLSFQAPSDPSWDPRAFQQRAPDPLRPETQAWLIRHLVEVAEHSRPYRNVTGIGFRVNGKIGTCYISGEQSSPGEFRLFSAEHMGYSSWNLSEFRNETGLDVPEDSKEAYAWLKADAGRWDRWLDFRCRRTRVFWLAARDAVRAVRPDFTLYVLTDLPAEVPDTNVNWPGPDAPDAEPVTLDLLRAHGFDPRMYKDDEGIIIQRVMMIDMERFFSKWGPPFGSNPERYRDFHEQPSLAKWYRTPAGAASEMYHTYWEEPFHPDGEFGPGPDGFGLRTATATAMGRTFYRPMTFSMRVPNDDTLVLNGWIRPVMGHEHGLRRFGQAMRALPVADPSPLQTSPASDRITAAWYDDRIGIINDTPDHVRVTVTLDRSLPDGKQLRDVATGHVPIPARARARDRFELDLEPYDLRTLVMERPGR